KLFEKNYRTEPLTFKEILYTTFSENREPLESAGEFFDKMLKRYGSNSGLSFEIFSEASHNPALRRVLKKTQDEYAAILMSYLEEERKRGFIDRDLDLRSITYAMIALWNGIETIVVTGLPVEDARRAWLEGFKAIFLQPPTHKRN